MTIRINSAEFIAGFADIKSMPPGGLPEVAMIGRSNAGKSTLINRLTNYKRLARVSATPGRTQQINLFTITAKDLETAKDLNFILTDLPGYGYAKIAKTKRADLSDLIADYFELRDELKVVCLLSDIRREITNEEVALRDFIVSCDRHFLLILTKADKVSRSQIKPLIKERAKSMGLEPQDILYSGVDVPNDNIFNRLLSLL